MFLLQSQVHCWHPELWKKLESNISSQDTPKQAGLSQTSFYCSSFTSHLRAELTMALHPELGCAGGCPAGVEEWGCIFFASFAFPCFLCFSLLPAWPGWCVLCSRNPRRNSLPFPTPQLPSLAEEPNQRFKLTNRVRKQWEEAVLVLSKLFGAVSPISPCWNKLLRVKGIDAPIPPQEI